ncbi:hypothetical protein Tco_1335178 [Tanacetum coccineum]
MKILPVLTSNSTAVVNIEQRVKDDQKARILELKQRNHKDYYSDNLYTISIKEDTMYLCLKLHSTSTKEDLYAVCRRSPYAVLDCKSWNILEYNNCGAYAKKPQYAILNSFNMAEQVGVAGDLGSTNDVLIPWECMTRSLTKDLLTPFKELERVLHSIMKLFKTLSLDYSSSSEFDLFSDLDDQSEEEKGRIELKGWFLLELHDNAFSGINGEDAVEHIENFLKIVDSLNLPNVTHDRLREDGYYNAGDLPEFIREGNLICYEDYEWYTTLEDSELKEEALNNKAILEESMNVEGESSDDAWSHYSPIDE